MDSNRNVLDLLDVLYAMVTDAWSVPLGNDKCIIEREKAVALINDIKASLPSSVAEAQRLVAARDEFIGNAKREAENILKQAEQRAKQMISREEVYRQAEQEAAAEQQQIQPVGSISAVHECAEPVSQLAKHR